MDDYVLMADVRAAIHDFLCVAYLSGPEKAYLQERIKRIPHADVREDAIRAASEIEGFGIEIRKNIWGIPAADVRENVWISVEDELPAFNQKVLAFVKNKDPKCRFNPDGVYVAELKDKIPVPDPKGEKNIWGIPGYDSEWTVWAWSYFSEPCITHWMPLPEPPEVKDDD